MTVLSIDYFENDSQEKEKLPKYRRTNKRTTNNHYFCTTCNIKKDLIIYIFQFIIADDI